MKADLTWTDRRREARDLILAGATSTEIAAAMKVSATTARKHVENVLALSRVSSMRQLQAREIERLRAKVAA